jgi:hypothetical protein
MPDITVRIDNEGVVWLHNPMDSSVAVHIAYDDGRKVEVMADYLHPMDRSVAPRFWSLEDFLRTHDDRAHWDSEDYNEAIEARYQQFFEEHEAAVNEALNYVSAPELGGDEWEQIRDEFRDAFSRVGLLDELDAMQEKGEDDDDTED